MCHCGRCAGCTLYKDTLRRIAAENRENLLRRKIPPNQMFADRYPPRYPGPAPVVRFPPPVVIEERGRGRVPNLFQENPNLRVRYPTPERIKRKEPTLTEEDAYYGRMAQQEMAREAYLRDKRLAKMDRPKTPKKKADPPVDLSRSPAKKKKRAPRKDPLFTSVNYDGKKKAYGNLRDRK